MRLEDRVAVREVMEAGDPFPWVEGVRASYCVEYHGPRQGAFHRSIEPGTGMEAVLAPGAEVERAPEHGHVLVLGPELDFEAGVGVEVGVGPDAVFGSLSGMKAGRDWLVREPFGVVVVVVPGRARRGIRPVVCVALSLLCWVDLVCGAFRRGLVWARVEQMNHFRYHMRRRWVVALVAGAGLLLGLACRRGTVAACACLSDRYRVETASDVVDARAVGPY
ncbi:unnamed protein product [Penicillium salamii]|uniref:Uncharacterized protein n=1 Tax=Penicillium salamii TaxID=1612424 RepID=A0A9W4NXQ7_9EURO|nr:unnamed protein product [Penicillium salamii]